MKVLISNIFGKANKGDQALFETLIYFLLEKEKITNIKLLAHHTEGLTDYSDKINLYKPVNNISSYGKLKAILIPFILFFSYFYIQFPFLFKLFLRKWQRDAIDAYRDVDYVISCPGGFLEDSTKSYFASIFQLYTAIVLNKKLIIAPQSIGPIKGKFSKFLLKYVLLNSEIIFTRENFSYNFVTKELGIKEDKVKMSADMAFFYDEYKKFDVKKDVKKDDILYSTVVNWNFPDTIDSKIQARENYIISMANFYKYLFNNYNIKVTILNQVNSDLPMAYDIQKITGIEVLYVDKKQYEPLEMITKIGTTNYFVGTRFHSCIFSMISHVPFIAISYLPKTHGIMEYLDLLGYEIDIYNISSEKLIQQFEIMKKEKENFKKDINDKLLFLKNKNDFQKYINGIFQ